MSAISKAISKSQAETGNNSKPVDTLERQIESAEFYGQILPEHPPEKRGRGRPKNTSKSPGPPGKTQMSIPDEFPSKSKPKEAFDEVLYKMTRTRLLTKAKAYHAYWPEVCPLSAGELASLDNKQLELLIDAFELSVNSYSQIVDLPQGMMAVVGKLEPIAISIGAANPSHPVLSKGVYMSGFAEAIKKNPNIDRSIKLLAIRALGRIPQSPFLSLLFHVSMTAVDVIKLNRVS